MFRLIHEESRLPYKVKIHRGSSSHEYAARLYTLDDPSTSIATHLARIKTTPFASRAIRSLTAA